MTRHSVPVVFCAVILIGMICSPVHADPYEFHGGIFTSYEYTDNYFGTSHDEESESIYEVGPTASFLWDRQTTQLELSGHAARSFHKEFDDDDSTDVFLDSVFTTASSQDSLQLAFGYTKTNRRAALSEVSGDSRHQRGSLIYSRALTEAATMRLNYDYHAENYQYPNDDIISHGITGTISDRVLEHTTLRVNGGYDLHYYSNGGYAPGEIPLGDTWNARSGLGIEQQVTNRSTIGVDGSYNHQGRLHRPDGDIISAYLTWGYVLASNMELSLSGGYSWLSMEDMDREGTYSTRGELTGHTEYDTIALRASREYTAEFTEDRYGIYDSRSVGLSWRRDFLRELYLETGISYAQRKPVSDIEGPSVTGEEKDFTGSISMTWTLMEHLIITPSYRRLQRIEEVPDTALAGHEITETERENRYMIRVEVRY